MSTSANISTPVDSLTRAHAPGKIILSGDHAVVYGAPALAVAVARYTEVTFTPMSGSGGLRTVFGNLSQFYPLDLVRGLKHGLDQRFERFLKGELKVQQILQRPDDLVIYTLASLMQKLPLPGRRMAGHLPVPGQLSSRSDLPIGAGMGSSASVIASTIVLYETLLGHPLTLEDRFEMVRFCERLQHGKGGAIDAATIVNGGMVRVENGAVTRCDVPAGLDGGWFWTLHGTPASSTGESVAAVRRVHGSDQALWDAFAACTNAFQASLDTDPTDAVRENHRLLDRIGVVPTPARHFIDVVEQRGGAAKVCGAGAVRGDHAGIIIVRLPEPGAIEEVMAAFPGRQWGRLDIAPQGAQQGPAPCST